LVTNSQIPDELFHYCPNGSFYGIISSKTLWLSNSEYANDPNENKIAIDILIDISKDSSDSITKSFANKVLDGGLRFIGQMTAFVFCMSESKDELNQWRIYADNGYGYALGFNPQYFIVNNLWIPFVDIYAFPKIDKIYLSKCIYDYSEQRSIVETLLKYYASTENPGFINNIVGFLIHLRFISSIFKHKSYSSENEWRIFCWPLTSFPQPEIDIKHSLFFRSRERLIIQYIKQNFLEGSIGNNYPVKSIVLGSNVRNQISEIRSFLNFTDPAYTSIIMRSKLKIQEIK
jgi:hypothetical protein